MVSLLKLLLAVNVWLENFTALFFIPLNGQLFFPSSGKWQDSLWPDDWTAVTVDGKRSAQFEHTLIVTETGCDVLTARQDKDGRPHFLDQLEKW